MLSEGLNHGGGDGELSGELGNVPLAEKKLSSFNSFVSDIGCRVGDVDWISGTVIGFRR